MAQIFDAPRAFQSLKKVITDGVEKTFPVSTDNRELTISNVRVDDSKASTSDYKAQKELKLQGKDFVAPVYGDITLKDKKTGNVIDVKKNFRIMDVPVMTDRYSYILGGNEYTVDKQLRMKPGIYTREKENGELESQFNLARGGGRGFKLWMNPEDGVFKLKIGTANPPLYPLLKTLGVNDSDMKKMWGDKLFLINQSKGGKNADSDIGKIYKSIFQKEAPSNAQAQVEIKDFFDKTILSAETTKRTLGKGFDKVEPETLLLTSKRLLDVSRGTAEADDRDSLVFKNVYDTPDLVQARIESSQRKVINDIKRVMDKRDKVTEIVSKDMLNKPVRQFFVQGTVAHAAEQENPTTILAEATKVTSLGEGAIGDMNAVTESMRDVNASHAGVLDPVATPESERIGLNLHLALGAGLDGKELETVVKDLKTGKTSYQKISDIFDKTMAFPDQYDKNGKPVHKDRVMVMRSGKITEVKPNEVDVVMNSPKQMFGYISNMVPFAANIQGNRAFMANKMFAQAIPLKYREQPLVQTKMPTGNTFEHFVGGMFATVSDLDGTVESVDRDHITIKGDNGQKKTYNLYNNFPLNNKSFVDSNALVKKGDKVTVGQTLADTSFTKDGTLAIGTNLRIGYLPFRDTTFEDGYTISESAAKKLTSEHLRETAVQISQDDLMDKKSFIAHYPTAANAKSLDKLDESGVIRVGQKVEPGDVLIAHLQKVEASEEDAKLGKLSKKLVKGFRNDAQIWDKNVVGTVTDVYKDDKGIKVFVRTEEPAQIGDKIVNRHGAKGIISAVIPDNEMPVNKAGERIDVAVSPSAIPGRINPSQIFEAAAGKLALKRGKPMKIENFGEHNTVKELKSLLKEQGLTDKEELIDPTNGQSLGKVMVGDSYYMKLMHQVDKKINARGINEGYDIDLQPTKGGHTSARALDRLTFQNLVAHGARENLYEMTNYKAEKNPELWRNVEMGLPLPAPKTPFVFDKLMGYMAAGGVNVKKEGNKLRLLPFTDNEVLARSNGEIDDARVVVSKNMRPVRDGLFDDNKTGGLRGTKWTHVHLAEPLLNPVMENAALSVLDITQSQLNDINAGKLYWDNKSKQLTKNDTGLTAGKALETMLSGIDVQKELNSLKESAKHLKGQGLDKANKKMRFLRALNQNDLKPADAYMIHNVPILPPQFRPMYPMPNGSLNTAPINFLYRDMIMVNKQLKDLSFLDDSSKSDLRKDLYQSVKAIQGLGDPLVQRGEKKIIGAIDLIKGDQPKTGYFQSVVFSKNQDLSGSSTITPSTDMSPDEILLPRDMAWNLYQPFAIKELVSMGYKPLDAKVMVEKKDPIAGMALEKVSKERPVWLNRAPTLHKFGIMAFQPRLYNGKSIGVHPTVCGGFNADFDGDTMGIYVPVSHKAVEEAKQFTPSKCLEHAADGSIMLKPSHDIMTGMFYMTRSGKDLSQKYSFGSVEDALKKYKTKEIEMYDTITIAGKKTTIGKELVGQVLPESVKIPEAGLSKKTMGGFLKNLSKTGPEQFNKTMDQLSKLSAKYDIYSSISLGLDDLEPDYDHRDKLVAETQKMMQKAKTDDDKRRIIAAQLPRFDATVKDYIAKHPETSLSQLMNANGKPSFDQYKQLISTPFAVSDVSGKAFPVITTKSYAEGLPVSEYWATSYGARTGMIQKRLETAEPGYFAKQVLSATINNVISEEDCGTKEGVVIELEKKNDIVGRYEAGTNILIDEAEYTRRLKSGAKTIKLRSPLMCNCKEGTCSKCFGLRENGKAAQIGDNVGALAGTFLSEPMTQGSMKAFHSGAVLGAGASVSGGLKRMQQLTLVPDYLKDKATLAKADGKIERIEDNPAGGKNIFIAGERHLTGPRNIIKYKVGDTVHKGDALTDGPVKPQELLELKGMEATQKYLVDSMQDTLKGMGKEMNRKLLETVVRSTTNLTTIKDPGNHPYYVAGEQVPLSEVRSWNLHRQNELDLDMALGAKLAVGAGPYKAGATVDREMIKVLRNLRINTVTVESTPIKHTPSLVGMNLLARMGRDWVANMSTNYIEQGITSGVQTGAAAPLHSYHPVTSYVMGPEFNKSEKGKY